MKCNLSNYSISFYCYLSEMHYLGRFYFFQKLGCYKPTPLRMNLAPEIRTDWKRYLKTLPSADLLFAKWLRLWYGYSTALCTFCSDYSG
jgi:hypothetical protein